MPCGLGTRFEDTHTQTAVPAVHVYEKVRMNQKLLAVNINSGKLFRNVSFLLVYKYVCVCVSVGQIYIKV